MRIKGNIPCRQGTYKIAALVPSKRMSQKTPHMKLGVALLMIDKTVFKTRSVIGDKEE